MKKFLLLALASLSLATACKKDDSAPAIMQLSGTMNAAQEVPATSSSTATATITGTYDPSTKLLTYSVAYSGLTPIAGHLHFGDPRHANPAAKFLLFSDVTRSPITGSTTLNVMQADSLLAGHTYANLHTMAYPAGEIRANLTVK